MKRKDETYRKMDEKKLGDVCYICNFISYDCILDCKFYKCSTMILAMIGSYKLGNWIGRFSVWTNDKVLGSEEDSNGD